MTKKIIIPLVITVIAAGAGLGIFLYWQSKSEEECPSCQKTPEPSPKSSQVQISSWQDLEKIEVPNSSEIENIKYDSGGFDCCLCAAIAAQYEHLGNQNYQDLLRDMAAPAMIRSMDEMFQAMAKYNLKSKLRLGYYYQGQSEEARSEMQNFFAKHLDNPKEQIKLFRNKEEAYQTLQRLIAADIPVVIAEEEDPRIQSIPENEIGDDTFNLIVGYDSQKITYYTLPNLKATVALSDFKNKWELQDTVFQYPVIPGNYTMVFLLPN